MYTCCLYVYIIHRYRKNIQVYLSISMTMIYHNIILSSLFLNSPTSVYNWKLVESNPFLLRTRLEMVTRVARFVSSSLPDSLSSPPDLSPLDVQISLVHPSVPEVFSLHSRSRISSTPSYNSRRVFITPSLTN